MASIHSQAFLLRVTRPLWDGGETTPACSYFWKYEKIHGKCPHQIFEKDRFQNYVLGYKKHAKLNCLRDMICFLVAGENQQGNAL